MTKTTQRMTVQFFGGHIGKPEDKKRVSKTLKQLSKTDNKIWLSNDGRYGVTALTRTKSYVIGELKLYRDDAPLIGNRSGTEHELDLEDNEAVIEKTTFLYDNKSEIILLPLTTHFRSAKHLQAILTDRTGDVCYFSDVAEPDAMERLLRNKSQIYELEYRVKVANSIDRTALDEWPKKLLDVNDGEPGVLKFTVRGEYLGKEKKPVKPSLVSKVASAFSSGFIDRATAVPLGNEKPINLFNDRLKSVIDVVIDNKYPLAGSMKRELIRTYNENKGTLERFKP